LLEGQPKSELHEARIACERRNRADVTISQGGIGLREQHAVREIEDLPTELELRLSIESEIARQREIKDVRVGST
jgi:hypothetical protein